MAKNVKQAVAYIAFASFEFAGQNYEAGEPFTLPAGVTRDEAFDELRDVSKRRGNDQPKGIAFTETLPPLTPKGDPRVTRRVLPVSEVKEE